MEMEEACKDLEDLRCEMEMLRAEKMANYHKSESLKRDFEEQVVKLQNAKLENEKQAREIDAKSEEISMATQKYEELQSIFQEKESALKQLSLANESMRTGFKGNIKELEQVKKELLLSLDEANVKAERQENMVCGYKKEIEALKGLLSESQKKCCDAELRAQAPEELRRRNEMLDEFVREKMEIVDRLKWKNEQFLHLEEALNKVQEEFRASKKERESEKSNFANDISSLESSLDFEIQVANDLRSQLQMCNQALAHEESRRRLLEIERKESKEMYENIGLEYEEVKSNIEMLTSRRDEEIASIRNSMSTKNVMLKEMKFKNTHLEQENQELLDSLKEAQEAQINDVEKPLERAEERVAFLTEQLKNKNIALAKALAEISDERMKVDSLQSKVEQLEYVNVEYLSNKKELASCKGMLAEHSRNIGHAKEQAAQKVLDLQDNLQRTSYALEKANSCVSEKMGALDKVEFELQQERNVVRQLRKDNCDLETDLRRYHEENQESKRCMEDAIHEKMEMEKVLLEVEERFLLLLEEKEREVLNLELIKVILIEHLARINLDISAIPKMVLPQSVMKKIDESLILIETIERRLNFFQDAIDLPEQNHETRDISIWMYLEKFRATYVDFIEEKLGVISDIQEQISSYDEGYSRLVEVAADSRLADKLVELSKMNDQLDKLIFAQILDKQELQYKSLLIDELEKYVVALLVKLEYAEKLSSRLSCSVQQLQAQSAKEKFHLQSELEKLNKKQRCLEEEIEAGNNRKALHDQVIEKLTQQKELLIDESLCFGDLIGKVFSKGKEVRKNWENILQKTLDGVDTITNMEHDDLISCKMTDGRMYTSTLVDKAGEILDRRLPLQEQNFNC